MSTDDRTLELLNAELDGELTAAERAELEHLLAESAAACALRDDLATVHARLADAPQLPLPDGLHERIITTVRLPGEAGALPTRRAGAAAPQRSWRDWLQPASWLPLAGATTAGALFAVLVLGDGAAQPGTDALLGTLAPGVAESVELLDADRVDHPGLSASATLELRNGQPVVDVMIDSTDAAELALDFSATGWRVERFGRLDGEPRAVQLVGDVVRTRGLGQQRLAVQLHRDGGTATPDGAVIKLDYRQDGAVVHRGELAVSASAGAAVRKAPTN